jgi:hypothetical protein
LEATTTAGNFIKTDEKLGEDGKRRFNFMLGFPSLGTCPTSMDSLSSPK